jgi:hypothetical protein
MENSFSKRFGYRKPKTEITIREGAPRGLRMAIIEIARELGLQPSQLRETICRVLLKAPNQDNWSEYPNVWYEVQELIYDAPWFKIYDIAEDLVNNLGSRIARPYYGTEAQRKFEAQLNEVFGELGIGWQMLDGKIQTSVGRAMNNRLRSLRLNILSSTNLHQLKTLSDNNTNLIYTDPSFFSHRNVVDMSASDEDLREFNPLEFQNWAVQQLGDRMNFWGKEKKEILVFLRAKVKGAPPENYIVEEYLR